MSSMSYVSDLMRKLRGGNSRAARSPAAALAMSTAGSRVSSLAQRSGAATQVQAANADVAGYVRVQERIPTLEAAMHAYRQRPRSTAEPSRRTAPPEAVRLYRQLKNLDRLLVAAMRAQGEQV
jgi:hypothetical protein